MLKSLILVSACLLTACAPAANQTELYLGTATLGGAYYPLGQGISNLVTQYAEGFTMVPIVTRGAVENPRLVSLGDVEIGLTNADLAYFGYQGQAPYDSRLNILAAGALHPSILHLITRANAGLDSMTDLRGKRVALGPAGGPTVAFASLLLNAYGMSFDDIVASFLSYSDGFSQLRDGNVDAAFALAGVPAAAVLQTRATQKLRFISIEPHVLAAIVDDNPYYSIVTVPAAVYDMETDSTVLAVDNMLVVGAEESADTVFSVVSAIYGHLDELQKTNAIARQINPDQSLKLPIPLHPGAARYFERR
ncbi:MAG: TAXI family TRAP transporter solute-binding subunit [Gammaproteobacteria bacterium]|nr:MAG: TAXI family TRAP transporter solute-binding subunit [Gammaproteobacteria bacterium]TDJ43903.1 MAG: TAXI family TRAP transporter solute-binding subunit [Gammaproteobacteria bacterium]